MPRIKCTKENPSDGEPYKWYHPDSILIEEVYDNSFLHDDYEIRKCPHCGITFEVTLPN